MNLKISKKLKPHLEQIRRCLLVLPVRSRKRLVYISVLQISLALLDLLGVALIGILGTIAVAGVQSRQNSGIVLKFLELVGIQNLDFQVQVGILGVAAMLSLLSRTLLSVFFARKTLHFLSYQGALISNDLASKLLSNPLLEINKVGTQERIYSLTTGVMSIVLSVLGTCVTIVSDLALLALMAVALLLVDPVVATSALLGLTLVSIQLYRVLHHRAYKLGSQEAMYGIRSNEALIEVFETYRESTVRARKGHYVKVFGKLRIQLATAKAEAAFMPYIGKYVIEACILIGSVSVSAYQFLQKDAAAAITALAVFLAAGARIAPALLRVQQGLLSIKSGLGSSQPTLMLIEELKGVRVEEEEFGLLPVQEHVGFTPSVQLTDIEFKYPSKNQKALSAVSFSLQPGQSLAIVGSSGAGKTTLADIILGIIELGPGQGNVKISGLSPNEAIRRWPGAIGYVPQNVGIVNGSVRENIGLGFDCSVIDDQVIWDALEIAQLEIFARGLEDGLDTRLGEKGSRLSGGQRQRIGIARAFLTKPKLVLLDEATSALDGQTEFDFVQLLEDIRITQGITLITIAHRLSTIKNADFVLFMENGYIKGKGTFAELRENFPDFENLVKLMQLEQKN
jgi:ABC-type multidrug transport system fused ATPase/permease subunit